MAVALSVRGAARAARPPSPSELLAAATLLALIAALAFGRHVAEGGFYSDDWANAADYRSAEPPKILSLASSLYSDLGSRPLLSLALPVPHALFGLDVAAHLTLAVGLAVLATVAFYALLRSLRIERRHAGAMAALALLFPWSDSTRLWATAGINNLSVLFFLLGLILALRGLGVSGLRGVLLHCCAQLFYLVSLLFYEAALPVIALSIVFYVHAAERPSVALTRWRADLALALVALIAVAAFSERDTPAVWAMLSDPLKFAGGGMALLGHAMLPVGFSDLAAAAAAGIVLMVLAGLASRAGTLEPELRGWLIVALTAAATAIAAHFMFVGSGLLPTRNGIENRVNLLAAYAYVALAYSLLIMGTRLLVPGRLRAAWASRNALVTALVLGVAAGYLVGLQRDIDRWDAADDAQSQVLEGLRRAIPRPPRGNTIFVFGAPGRISPGIPVFSETWDLKGAVQLEFDDYSLAAYPIYGATRFVCDRRSVYPVLQAYPDGPDAGYGQSERAPYGSGVFVDVHTEAVTTIRGQHQCQTAIRRFRPGPLFAD